MAWKISSGISPETFPRPHLKCKAALCWKKKIKIMLFPPHLGVKAKDNLLLV